MNDEKIDARIECFVSDHVVAKEEKKKSFFFFFFLQ
jgi:hypothetical protein